jgi:hypothetical protein
MELSQFLLLLTYANSKVKKFKLKRRSLLWFGSGMSPKHPEWHYWEVVETSTGGTSSKHLGV